MFNSSEAFTNDGFSVIKLGKDSFNRRVDDEVKIIYNAVKAEIIEQHEQGRNILKYQLPEIFELCDTWSQTRVQVVIYSKIMKIFEAKGFLCILDDTAVNRNKFLILRWQNAIEPQEETELRDYLRARLARGKPGPDKK
jgi:hypothetical protein